MNRRWNPTAYKRCAWRARFWRNVRECLIFALAMTALWLLVLYGVSIAPTMQ